MDGFARHAGHANLHKRVRIEASVTKVRSQLAAIFAPKAQRECTTLEL